MSATENLLEGTRTLSSRICALARRSSICPPASPTPSDEPEFDPEAPCVLDAGLADLGNLIAVLSGPSISVFTSALFDFVLAEAQYGG